VTSPFAATLAPLVRLRGVQGALVVDERDGIVVDAVLQVGMRGDVISALAASLFRRARLAADAAGFGRTSFLELEAEGGRLCAAGMGELVVVAVVEGDANIGLVRMQVLRAAEGLAP
jgi:predicted regulator of Ras-like GTPase activity (Roadblock/LC7/MglB family)